MNFKIINYTDANFKYILDFEDRPDWAKAIEWCNTNFGNSHQSGQWAYGMLRIGFCREEDRTLFVLRWS